MTQSDRALAAARQPRPRIDPRTVVGWGVDADPDNDPTWPMRDRGAAPDSVGDWDPPAPQSADVEVLESVEHVRRPAVLGETLPPRGLSGVLRRRAFRFSESQFGHWLLLMAADRVDVVEGLLRDLGRGRPPNPLAEMGLVPRRHARAAGIAAGAAAVGLVAVAAGLALRRRAR